MSKRIFAIILSLVMAVGLAPAMAFAETEPAKDYGKPGRDYAEGQAIICLKETASAAKLAKQKGMGDFEVEPLMKVSGLSGGNAKAAGAKAAAGDFGVLALVTGEKKTADMIEELEQNPQVEYAEPNYLLKAYGAEEPADPGYPYQYHLKNRLNADSSAAEMPAADTNISKAWQKAAASGKSDKKVVVVMDDGVDYNHPDLKEIMWDDGLKIPELQAMGGGKYGYNLRTDRDSDDPMSTDSGHGTHCAGVIAAQWNDRGVAGVSGKDIEIMAIRVIGSGALLSDAVRGYAYIQTAAENGVDIAAVNNSWGPVAYNLPMPASVITAANTVGKKYGIISCCAAGNSATNNDLNVSSVRKGEYIINVGSMDSAGAASPFSCYGRRTVDVFAPGSQILSATTTDESVPQQFIHQQRQYLPQMMDEDQSWFYEDFEDGESKVELKLLDKDGKAIETAKAAAGPGAGGGRGLQLPLDAVKEGESFAIEMTVPKAELAGIEGNDDVYMAFQAGAGDAFIDEAVVVKYLDESGKWEFIDADLAYGDDFAPVAVWFTDRNWNQGSYKLRDPKVLDTKGENLTLRFIPSADMRKSDSGRKPVFRLDNVGFGKSAVPYCYADGTSMAAPVITGLAGMMSAGTDLTPAEICAGIKGGVNRRDAVGLEDKSVSGGFIDAAAAFDETKCVPVLNKLTAGEGKAVLNGYFFGDNRGTLIVDGKTVSAEKWTDTEITFAVTEEVSGMKEVRVVRAGTDAETDYGRNFFTIEKDSTDFCSLTAPNLEYGQAGNTKYPLSSADYSSDLLAAADGKIVRLGIKLDTAEAVMELYDIASDTWKKIKTPGNFQFVGSLGECYSMTASGNKLYLLYVDQGSNTHMGIYDLNKGTWKILSDTDLICFQKIVAYQDKLLAVGGEDPGKDEAAFSSVKAVDPNTGKIIGSLTDMPEARSAAKVCASGDKLYVSEGYDCYYNMLVGKEYKKYDTVMVYDGRKWTVNSEPFFSEDYSGFDKEQMFDFGTAAADNGLFAVGPVKNLDGKDMRDTWFYDAEKNTWSAREDLHYSGAKTANNAAVCYDGSLYVLAQTGMPSGPLIFRELPGISCTAPKDKLTAQPAAPKLKGTGGLTSAKLSWSKVSGATGYEIYRAASKNGTYKKIFTTKKQSWTNTGLTTGKTYYYKVRGYKKSQNAAIYGKYSGKTAVTPRPGVPAFKLTALDNGAKVTWSKVSGATGYRIYRATEKSGAYMLIKTAKSTDRSYISKKLKNKKTYYYKMRSYKTVKGKKIYSKYSAAKSVKTK